MKNNYIIIGDSIPYGVGRTGPSGWADLFKSDIVLHDDTKECSSYVHLAAFPGATSEDIKARANGIFEAFKSDSSRNIVILAIGLNDSQEINLKRKVLLPTYEENMQNIIKFFQERAEVFVVGLTKVQSDGKFSWKPGKFYENSVIKAYDSFLEEISPQLCAQYISLRGVLTDDDYVDGVHPNDNGHRKIFEVVKEKVESYLKSNSDEIQKNK